MNVLLRTVRRRTLIGLDIGTGGARAVQLTRRGDRHTIGPVAVGTWSPETTEDGNPSVEAPGNLGDRLLGLRGQDTFRGRRVVTGVNPPAVTFQSLDLPSSVFTQKDANLPQVVRWEMERLLTEKAQRVETRHWALPKPQAPAATAIGVAADRAAIFETLAHCRKAGLSCVRVDASAAALARFGARLRRWESKHVWGVLDIGLLEARLVLCADDTPVLVRRGGGGGHAWTTRVAEALQLSLSAADVQKRDHGIALNGRGARRETDGRPDRDSRGRLPSILLGALRNELRHLAAEVKRSYEYVLSCYPRRQAADLILVGGGAAMRNLPEYLGDALGIPVRRASDYLGDAACRLQCCCKPGYGFEDIASAVGLAIEP